MYFLVVLFTMESLTSRLGSGSSASFSGRLPAPSSSCDVRSRPPHHLIRAYQTSRGAQAIAITWDDSYSDSDWGSDTTDGQPAVMQPRREFAIQQRAPKPLKINRDLLLVSKQSYSLQHASTMFRLRMLYAASLYNDLPNAPAVSGSHS